MPFRALLGAYNPRRNVLLGSCKLDKSKSDSLANKYTPILHEH